MFEGQDGWNSFPITIVVEFGGLICENKFPDVGEPIEGALDALNKLKEVGKEVLKKHLLSLNSEKIGIFLFYIKLYVLLATYFFLVKSLPNFAPSQAMLLNNA